MHLLSHPISTLQGDIQVSGDKSISHRAIIFSAITEGTRLLEGLSDGEDCLATLAAFRQMGVGFETPSNGTILIHGVGKYGLMKPAKPIDCGNSGTTMRLLAGLLAAQPFDTLLIGDTSLQNRPMARIQTPLSQMGALIETASGSKAPLFIRGGQCLRGIDYEIPVASAQVKSCLVLAALYANGPSHFIEPCLTRNHTENILPLFGLHLEQETLGNGQHSLYLKGCKHESGAKNFRTPKNIHQAPQQGKSQKTLENITLEEKSILSIPGDFSSAAFFIVAATLIPDASLTIKQVGVNPTRTGLLDILIKMGANISINNPRQFGKEPVADLVIKSAPLIGVSVPKTLIPLMIDELPILCIAAACAEGLTDIRGAQELRFKESDRIESMIIALRTLGVEATAFPDGLSIRGIGSNRRLKGGSIFDSFFDHRIAMSLAIAGTLTDSPVLIKNCKNIVTSFPDFVPIANRIGFNIQERDM